MVNFRERVWTRRLLLMHKLRLQGDKNEASRRWRWQKRCLQVLENQVCEDCVFRVFLYSCCHWSNIFWSLSRKLHFDFGTSSSVLVKDDHLMQFVYVVDGKRLSSSHTASPELGV
jgi:hypothetical protein